MRTVKYIYFFSLVFLCALLYNTSALCAQTPDWIWAASAGGSKDDIVRNIAQDNSGNIYVTGSFSSDSISFENITLKKENAENMFLVKYDSNGNVIWARSAEGVTSGNNITTDQGGNVYVIGSFYSDVARFGGIPLVKTGDFAKMFIVKYDSTGKVLWVKSPIINNNYNYAVGIASDLRGNIYVTGRFSGPSITFNTITLTNPIDPAISTFLVKYDADGTALWARLSALAFFDQGNSIICDNKGNITLTGILAGTNSFGNTIVHNAGLEDILVMQYDSLGTVTWAKGFGGTGTDIAQSITKGPGGDIYITGYFKSPTFAVDSITLVNTMTDRNDMVIIKLSSSGQVLWAKSFGGTDNEYGLGISADDYDNIYVIGGFKSPALMLGNTTLTGSGQYDMFIAKFTSMGNALWSQSFPGKDGRVDQLKVSITGRDALYMTGTFNSPSIQFGSKTLNNIGNRDIFIAKAGALTDINEFPETSSLPAIFPNPTKSTFHISGIEPGNWNITIYSLTGEKIYESLLKDSRMIDLSGRAKGMYVYQLQKDGAVLKTGKIIIE